MYLYCYLEILYATYCLCICIIPCIRPGPCAGVITDSKRSVSSCNIVCTLQTFPCGFIAIRYMRSLVEYVCVHMHYCIASFIHTVILIASYFIYVCACMNNACVE